MRKRSKPQEPIRKRPEFSPYQQTPEDNMDDFYARYLADPTRIMQFGGRTYYKIIHFWHFTARSENEMIVTVDSKIGIRTDDFLMDENGNKYQIKGCEMICFRGEFPEWYGKISGLLLVGDPFRLGEYLTHM